MDYDFRSYEFYEFLDEVQKTFRSQFARAELLSSLKPLSSEKAIADLQNIFAEAMLITSDKELIENDDDIFKLTPTLKNEQKSYDPKDFLILANFLARIELLKHTLLADKKLRYLYPLVSNLNTLQELVYEFRGAIDDNGEIKDDATAELKSIRNDQKIFKAHVVKTLQSVLNSKNASKFIWEDTINVRNGRYTISCMSNFHQYIEGIIQDRSASGQTYYIEPSSIVSINNAVQELIIKESEEIAKIIAHLIAILKASLDDIFLLIQSYSKLSMYLELGYFYKSFNTTFAVFSDESSFKELHHPLLFLYKKTESIGIDIAFDKDKTLVVITGPNTGGKTAALKSLGLNLILTYCGLPIFASSARYQIFDKILADIGDKQSLVMSLSTFSSHMINIAKILEDATTNSLIIFDELGTGTEAREGAALAIAIISYLEKIGAKTALTTHFPEVKNYALNSLNGVIYSVDFDYEKFEPRYYLIRDVAGRSDPILIAKRLGFKHEIIEQAKLELSKYKSSIDMQIEEIDQLKAANNHKARELEKKERELDEKELSLTTSSDELKKKLNSKERDILEESYALLQRAKRLATEKGKISQEVVTEALEKTAEKLVKIKADAEKVSEIEVNDTIFLERYGKQAKVLKIENEFVQFDINGMKVKIRKDEIIGKKIDTVKKVKIAVASKDVSSDIRREIVLVGKRVEEALDILDMFIDKSIGAGFNKIYIIHGRGTGQLRKALHEYLRTRSGVASYKLAEQNDGGNAVTIAEL